MNFSCELLLLSPLAIQPRNISRATFSASATTVDCGCLSGSNQNTLASTTLCPFIRKTRALGINGGYLVLLLAHLAGATRVPQRPALCPITSKIRSFVVTHLHGKHPSPATMPLKQASISRRRLRAGTASCWSLGWVSQAGMMTGGWVMLAL